MAREIGDDPGRRAAALGQDRAELDQRAIGQLAAADALRLQHAEKAACMQIGDGFLGHAAKLFAFRGARAQTGTSARARAFSISKEGGSCSVMSAAGRPP